MPAAINFSTRVTVTPRDDRVIAVSSENFQETFKFDLDDTPARAKGQWSDYVRGVALTLEQAGYRLKGAQLQIRANRHLAADLKLRALQSIACLLQRHRNSANIIAPPSFRACRRVVEVKLEGLLKIL